MPSYTTAELIKAAKRRGSVPTNQSLYTDQDFVDTFSDCQEMRMIPNILRVREEFFVSNHDIPAANQTEIAIPPRAIGMRLRQLQTLNANGEVICNIQNLNPTAHQAVREGGYYFQDNKIIIPADLTRGAETIRIRYYRRPSRLALEGNAAKVLAINTNTGEITVDKVPPAFGIGDLVDLIPANPPFQSAADDVTISNIAGFTITIPAADAAKLAVGDWICSAGESVIPQYAVELHPILVQYAVVKILTSLGDIQGAAAAANDLDELERNLYEMLAHRDDGSQKKLIAPNTLWDDEFDFGVW